MYSELTKIGQTLNLKIDIIGSYATGLWTIQSDIDIVFTNIESVYIKIEEVLNTLYLTLKQRSSELKIK